MPLSVSTKVLTACFYLKLLEEHPTRAKNQSCMKYKRIIHTGPFPYFPLKKPPTFTLMLMRVAMEFLAQQIYIPSPTRRDKGYTANSSMSWHTFFPFYTRPSSSHDIRLSSHAHQACNILAMLISDIATSIHFW